MNWLIVCRGRAGNEDFSSDISPRWSEGICICWPLRVAKRSLTVLAGECGGSSMLLRAD